MPNVSDSDGPAALAVALVMPNATRRRALVAALAGTQFAPLVHEFGSYPSRDELPAMARLGCRVLIVDRDDDVEQAIHVIENMGRYKAAMTVMAASSRSDSALMRRSMQAGARDFLVEPFLPETVGAGFCAIERRRRRHHHRSQFCAGADEGVRRQSRGGGHGLSTG